MIIKNMVSGLWKFFASFRGSGTSTLIVDVAKNSDVFVVVVDQDQAKLFIGNGVDKRKILTIGDITNGNYQGLKGKPILVDNFVMLQLLERVDKKFDGDERRIERAETFIKELDSLMKVHSGEIRGRHTTTVTSPEKY